MKVFRWEMDHWPSHKQRIHTRSVLTRNSMNYLCNQKGQGLDSLTLKTTYNIPGHVLPHSCPLIVVIVCRCGKNRVPITTYPVCFDQIVSLGFIPDSVKKGFIPNRACVDTFWHWAGLTTSYNTQHANEQNSTTALFKMSAMNPCLRTCCLVL